VEEQLNQNNALNVKCAYCGAGERDGTSREQRAEYYQILVACAQCGNEFAAISRN
jgi:DNA-directed RNA polymerase subunit RPC12/RpoP